MGEKTAVIKEVRDGSRRLRPRPERISSSYCDENNNGKDFNSREPIFGLSEGADRE